jgi:nucleotide-binding universal stress UspA family protein
MIRDILVNLSAGKPRDAAGDFATSAASLFGAHLSAVAFAYEPPIGGSVLDGWAPSVIDRWRADRRAEAERAQAAFDATATAAQISADSRLLAERAADAARIFGALARSYDFSIVAQAETADDLTERLTIEAALFESGRPVMIVPYIQKSGIKLDRVMACWDGSRNAARAISDAIPLLRKATQIDVVTVDHKDRRNELRGLSITQHLARHGLSVDLKSLVAPDSDAANVILSQAADSGADLIVMGGYGHTRLREIVLGGVTREMLKAMTVPVLMSH